MKCKPLDLLEDTELPVPGATRASQDPGMWRLPAMLSLMALLGHSNSKNPTGPAPSVLATARCWELSAAASPHTFPLLQHRARATGDSALKEFSSWTENRRTGRDGSLSHPSSALHKSKASSEDRTSFRTTAGAQRPNPLPTQLWKPFCSQYQFSAHSKEVFPPVKPLWDSYSQEKHQPWTQQAFWYFPPYVISIPIICSAEIFFHHKHLSPCSGRTGTCMYTHSLKTRGVLTTLGICSTQN